KVIVSDADEVLPALRSGQLDLVIQYLYPQAAPTGLLYIPLYEDETVPCCARNHRLAARDHVALGELCKERWTFQGSVVLGPYQRLHEVFRNNGLEPPRIAFESRSLSLRLQVAANSDLLMYTSRAVVARRLGAGTFHVLPVKELHWRQSVGVVHRKEPYMSPAVRRFIDILKTVAARAPAAAPPVRLRRVNRSLGGHRREIEGPSPTLSARWPQACDEPLDAVADELPIAKPVAREAHHNVGAADAPAVEAGPRRGTRAIAAAAHEKPPRRRGIVDQSLALIGCAIAKGEDRKAVIAGDGLGRDVAWIDDPDALSGRQRVAGDRNRDEQALECSA